MRLSSKCNLFAHLMVAVSLVAPPCHVPSRSFSDVVGLAPQCIGDGAIFVSPDLCPLDKETAKMVEYLQPIQVPSPTKPFADATWFKFVETFPFVYNDHDWLSVEVADIVLGLLTDALGRGFPTSLTSSLYNSTSFLLSPPSHFLSKLRSRVVSFTKIVDCNVMFTSAMQLMNIKVFNPEVGLLSHDAPSDAPTSTGSDTGSNSNVVALPVKCQEVIQRYLSSTRTCLDAVAIKAESSWRFILTSFKLLSPHWTSLVLPAATTPPEIATPIDDACKINLCCNATPTLDVRPMHSNFSNRESTKESLTASTSPIHPILSTLAIKAKQSLTVFCDCWSMAMSTLIRSSAPLPFVSNTQVLLPTHDTCTINHGCNKSPESDVVSSNLPSPLNRFWKVSSSSMKKIWPLLIGIGVFVGEILRLMLKPWLMPRQAAALTKLWSSLADWGLFQRCLFWVEKTPNGMNPTADSIKHAVGQDVMQVSGFSDKVVALKALQDCKDFHLLRKSWFSALVSVTVGQVGLPHFLMISEYWSRCSHVVTAAWSRRNVRLMGQSSLYGLFGLSGDFPTLELLGPSNLQVRWLSHFSSHRKPHTPKLSATSPDALSKIATLSKQQVAALDALAFSRFFAMLKAEHRLFKLFCQFQQQPDSFSVSEAFSRHLKMMATDDSHYRPAQLAAKHFYTPPCETNALAVITANPDRKTPLKSNCLASNALNFWLAVPDACDFSPRLFSKSLIGINRWVVRFSAHLYRATLDPSFQFGVPEVGVCTNKPRHTGRIGPLI